MRSIFAKAKKDANIVFLSIICALMWVNNIRVNQIMSMILTGLFIAFVTGMIRWWFHRHHNPKESPSFDNYDKSLDRPTVVRRRGEQGRI